MAELQWPSYNGRVAMVDDYGSPVAVSVEPSMMLTRLLVCRRRSLISSLSADVHGCVFARYCRILMLASTMEMNSGAQYGSPAGRLYDVSRT